MEEDEARRTSSAMEYEDGEPCNKEYGKPAKEDDDPQ